MKNHFLKDKWCDFRFNKFIYKMVKDMKKIICLWGSLSFVSISAIAEDVVDAWSGNDKITKIYSTGSVTYFKLANNPSIGCGHPDLWGLAIPDASAMQSNPSLVHKAQIKHRSSTAYC